MTKDFQDMLYLFSCAARGITPKPRKGLDAKKIMELAAAQDVRPLVFASLERARSAGLVHETAEWEKWKIETMLMLTKNVQRQEAVQRTIHALEEEGISCCMLKGGTLAALYQEPELRISVDTDLYIDSREQARAIRILKKQGYQIASQVAEYSHIPCRHPVAGLLELHVSLYDQVFDEVWFGRSFAVTEPYRQVTLPNGETVFSLGVTDGALFTALHYIKHFLSHGAGVRPLMDLLLYLERFQNEIHWDTFDDIMSRLKYSRFLSCLMAIGEEYLQFPKGTFSRAAGELRLLERVIDDMESGGAFGAECEERAVFDRLYSERRFYLFGQKELGLSSYSEYAKKQLLQGFWRKIFLKKENMVPRYPYLAKRPWLLPVAWVQRGWRFISRILLRRRGAADGSNEGAKQRMELIKDLDMI